MEAEKPKRTRKTTPKPTPAPKKVPKPTPAPKKAPKTKPAPKTARKRKPSLEDRAKEIIKLAEESGVRENYFFLTTFERYQMQISILADLKKQIEESEVLVRKEYVKGRKNLYTNPAITEYNRTTDSANKTVSCLMRIIGGFKSAETESSKDPLLSIINGGENDYSDDVDDE